MSGTDGSISNDNAQCSATFGEYLKCTMQCNTWTKNICFLFCCNAATSNECQARDSPLSTHNEKEWVPPAVHLCIQPRVIWKTNKNIWNVMLTRTISRFNAWRDPLHIMFVFPFLVFVQGHWYQNSIYIYICVLWLLRCSEPPSTSNRSQFFVPPWVFPLHVHLSLPPSVGVCTCISPLFHNHRSSELYHNIFFYFVLNWAPCQVAMVMCDPSTFAVLSGPFLKPSTNCALLSSRFTWTLFFGCVSSSECTDRCLQSRIPSHQGHSKPF